MKKEGLESRRSNPDDWRKGIAIQWPEGPRLNVPFRIQYSGYMANLFHENGYRLLHAILFVTRNPLLAVWILWFLLNAGPAPVSVAWAQPSKTPQAPTQAIKGVLKTGFPAPSELANEPVKIISDLEATGSIEEPKSTKPTLTPKQTQLNRDSFDYVWTTIRDTYFDPSLGGVDWNTVKDELYPKVTNAESMPQARTVLSDMVSRLKVSHFSIIPAAAYRDLRQPEKPRGGVAGIDVRVIDGRVFVTSVREGSPAEEAGVKTGCELVRIAEDDLPAKIKSMTDNLKQHAHLRSLLVSAVQSRLRGRIDETLSLILRNEDDREVELQIPFIEPRGRKTRIGNLPEFYVWIDVKTVGRNIGYIGFNAFVDPIYVMTKFNEAMRSFRAAEGIIIDVRGNGGGMGEMAMGMIGWLIDEGRPHLGTVIFRDNQLKMLVNPRPRPYRGPVVVLIDEMSVSAAEFFAGGVKDLGRAHLIGTRTAGAALGSSIEKLPNGDGFLYVSANYVSKKSGKPLEGIGVTPDTEVPHTREALLQGRDLAMESAIQWIRGQSR